MLTREGVQAVRLISQTSDAGIEIEINMALVSQKLTQTFSSFVNEIVILRDESFFVGAVAVKAHLL